MYSQISWKMQVLFLSWEMEKKWNQGRILTPNWSFQALHVCETNRICELMFILHLDTCRWKSITQILTTVNSVEFPDPHLLLTENYSVNSWEVSSLGRATAVSLHWWQFTSEITVPTTVFLFRICTAFDILSDMSYVFN
jgi:hypothetical protein